MYGRKVRKRAFVLVHQPQLLLHIGELATLQDPLEEAQQIHERPPLLHDRMPFPQVPQRSGSRVREQHGDDGIFKVAEGHFLVCKQPCACNSKLLSDFFVLSTPMQ